MRTLDEIIQSVRDGEKPDYDELRYAVCAMEHLRIFDRRAIMTLAKAERENKKPFLVTSAEWQWKEHFNRHDRAGEKSPKEYIGWNNDPDNPEFLKRREASKNLVNAIIEASE